MGAKRVSCSREGCTNHALKGGVCCRHGAKLLQKRCSNDGCKNYPKKGGVWIKHGAKVKDDAALKDALPLLEEEECASSMGQNC